MLKFPKLFSNTSLSLSLYIYIYIERERERVREIDVKFTIIKNIKKHITQYHEDNFRRKNIIYL